MRRTQGFWPGKTALIVCAVALSTPALADGQNGKPAVDEKNAGGGADAIVPVNLMQGIALAQQTATPMFVMLTRETCGNCRHLKGRITAEQELKDMLKNYVVVDVNVDGPLGRQWQSRFPNPGDTLPLVYVVAATGHAIHTGSGAQQGDALPNLLKQGLAQAEEIHQAAGLTRKKSKRRAAKSRRKAAAAKDDAEGKSQDKKAKAQPKPKRAPAKVDPLKQAASSLKMARTFAKNRPEKAIEYARKVIELAPDSPLAEEAKKLLEVLEE